MLDKPKIPSIRTFISDTAEYVRKRNVSMVNIAAEQAKTGQIKQPSKKEPFFGLKIFVFGFIFFVLAGLVVAGLWYVYFYKNNAGNESEYLFTKPVISTEKEEIVFVDSQNFLGQIKSAYSKQIPLGSMLNVVAAQEKNGLKKNIGTESFFIWSGIKYQTALLESLDEQMMFIKYYFSQEWPVLAVKVKYYDDTFFRMIKWEASMAKDLKPLLGLSFESLGQFHDIVVENRDARVLKDADGRDILMYSFINKDYLVITTSREALVEVFRRFSSPQYLNQ